MTPGACLCAALQYEVALSPAPEPALAAELVHCHCSRCRKHHGAPFASFVVAPVEALRWVRGEESVHGYGSSASRVRPSCGTCGAVAPARVDDRVLVPAGNLASGPGELGERGVLPGRHAFVGSKAPWHVIADDLPQHEGPAPAPGTQGTASGVATLDVDGPAAAQVEGAHHGSCLCRAVTFAVRGAPARWYQCHCSRCRRARSAAHGSNTFFPAAQFTWLTGSELVRGYRPPDAERFSTSFCERCGGGAPTAREGVPFVLVPAALLDGDLGRRPDAHIHVASKAPWFTFADGLPQFPELPPA